MTRNAQSVTQTQCSDTIQPERRSHQISKWPMNRAASHAAVLTGHLLLLVEAEMTEKPTRPSTVEHACSLVRTTAYGVIRASRRQCCVALFFLLSLSQPPQSAKRRHCPPRGAKPPSRRQPRQMSPLPTLQMAPTPGIGATLPAFGANGETVTTLWRFSQSKLSIDVYFKKTEQVVLYYVCTLRI